MTRNLYTKRQGVVRHEFLLGKSGQGKTEAILTKLAQQTRRGGGWAFVDAKPEEKTETIINTMASVYGRRLDLRVIDLRNPKNSHTYNPILSGNTTQAVSTVGNIFGGDLDASAKHFKTMMLAALQPAIGCIKEMNKAFNCQDLLILLTNPNAMNWLYNNTPASAAKTQYNIWLDGYRTQRTDRQGNTTTEIDTQRLRTQIMGGATAMHTYSVDELGEIMNPYSPQVTWRDVIENDRMLYIKLPTMEMREQAIPFAQMMLSDFKAYVGEMYDKGFKPAIPFLWVGDEFGSWAIEGAEELVEKMRGAGIGGIFSFQTYANLVRLSEEFAARMVGSCETRTFLALGDTQSREFASELIGELLKDFRSQSTSTGASKGNTNLDIELFHKVSQSTGESSGTQERYDYAVRPERFRDLGLGEAIVVPMAARRAFDVKFPLFDPVDTVPYVKRDIPTPDVVGLNLQAIFEQELALG
ncbi:TraD/TraG, TraM recognition site [Comamonadaceae bacterium]